MNVVFGLRAWHLDACMQAKVRKPKKVVECVIRLPRLVVEKAD